MSVSPNHLMDILDRASFTVQVTLDGIELSLKCRRMPFVTVMRLISYAARQFKTQLGEAQREALVSQFKELANVPVGDQDAAKSAGLKVIGQLIPTVLRLAEDSPDLLRQCVIDIVDHADIAKVVDSLPFELCLGVLVESFNRTDKAVIAKQVSDLFLGISTIAANTELLNKTETPSQS